ncbi:MAG: hypothetical protein J6U40_03630 [Kiritimatiellae bacterium]|nr:hypothetical protein [Kiritimatiellia bacterium]
MKKVLIPTKLDRVAAELLAANGGYEVIQDAKTPLPELVAAHPDTHALIVRSEKIQAETIDALPQLKVIVRAGAGYDTIDIRHARVKGVNVMNTPGANSNGVAEEVIALILADARHIIRADRSTREGKWEKKQLMGRELTGKTVGIVGLGHIGRLVAKHLKGFDNRILGYDPLIASDRVRDMGIEPATLEEIFSRADFITLHVPLMDSTRGLVNEALISQMKNGATLINCARYGIIDEDAFRKFKAEKNLRYLNDVYPKDAEGDKPNADIADIMMPHLGANTFEANFNAARMAAEELIDLDVKGDLACIVNRDIPAGLERSYSELAYTLANLVRQISGPLPIKLLETSFYGDLKPFQKWLLVSILAGIWHDFDPYNDVKAGMKLLEENGIRYIDRDVSDQKGYGNSITLDITVELPDKSMKLYSVRGTVTEGIQTVSRIDEFDRLYFEPKGVTLFCLYNDRPGVIATIARRLADAGINIEDMRNPHNVKTHRSLAILRLNIAPSANLVADIKDAVKADSVISTFV